MANKNLIGDGRPLRVCDLCGGVDDHPRHVIAGVVRGVYQPSDGALEKVMLESPEDERLRLVRDLMDTTSSDRHLDCCRAAGCPDGTCGVMTQGAEEARGVDLLAHLEMVGPERAALLNDVADIPQDGGR